MPVLACWLWTCMLAAKHSQSSSRFYSHLSQSVGVRHTKINDKGPVCRWRRNQDTCSFLCCWFHVCVGKINLDWLGCWDVFWARGHGWYKHFLIVGVLVSFCHPAVKDETRQAPGKGGALQNTVSFHNCLRLKSLQSEVQKEKWMKKLLALDMFCSLLPDDGESVELNCKSSSRLKDICMLLWVSMSQQLNGKLFGQFWQEAAKTAVWTEATDKMRICTRLWKHP